MVRVATVRNIQILDGLDYDNDSKLIYYQENPYTGLLVLDSNSSKKPCFILTTNLLLMQGSWIVSLCK